MRDMAIPRIDPNVKYKGTSYLRELNAENLRALEGAIVIQGTDLQPLAVIVSLETYLAMQSAATAPPANNPPFKGPLLKPKDRK